jgi:hypothetical protein
MKSRGIKPTNIRGVKPLIGHADANKIPESNE